MRVKKTISIDDELKAAVLRAITDPVTQNRGDFSDAVEAGLRLFLALRFEQGMDPNVIMPGIRTMLSWVLQLEKLPCESTRCADLLGAMEGLLGNWADVINININSLSEQEDAQTNE